MSECIERLIASSVRGAREAQLNISTQELEFEVFFNYLLHRYGQKRIFLRANVYDDTTFNTDGYKPTVFEVGPGICNNMTAIGVDFIKPLVLPNTERKLDLYDLENFHGRDVEVSLDGLYWVVFTIVDKNHPLCGVRYATAFRDGVLIYPPYDPTFTEGYPEDHIYDQSRGVIIDTNECFLKLTRPELYKTDFRGKLLND